MVGSPADMSKAEELFLKLDQNSDGYISQEEFITIIKQDHNLLNVLQKTAWTEQEEMLKYEYGRMNIYSDKITEMFSQ